MEKKTEQQIVTNINRPNRHLKQEESMNNAALIFTAILVVIYLLLIILMIRNYRVLKFRHKLIDDSFEAKCFNIYHEVPNYDEMLFSIKPLKYKYWLTPEQMDRLCTPS